MNILLILIYIVLGVVIAGLCVLIWANIYHWYADNRKINDTHNPRSEKSWNKEHEFFDTVTEYRNDFTS